MSFSISVLNHPITYHFMAISHKPWPIMFKLHFHIFLISYILGLCTTTTYTKSNGEIACGYDLKAALTWYDLSNITFACHF